MIFIYKYLSMLTKIFELIKKLLGKGSPIEKVEQLNQLQDEVVKTVDVVEGVVAEVKDDVNDVIKETLEVVNDAKEVIEDVKSGDFQGAITNVVETANNISDVTTEVNEVVKKIKVKVKQ